MEEDLFRSASECLNTWRKQRLNTLGNYTPAPFPELVFSAIHHSAQPGRFRIQAVADFLQTTVLELCGDLFCRKGLDKTVQRCLLEVFQAGHSPYFTDCMTAFTAAGGWESLCVRLGTSADLFWDSLDADSFVVVFAEMIFTLNSRHWFSVYSDQILAKYKQILCPWISTRVERVESFNMKKVAVAHDLVARVSARLSVAFGNKRMKISRGIQKMLLQHASELVRDLFSISWSVGGGVGGAVANQEDEVYLGNFVRGLMSIPVKDPYRILSRTECSQMNAFFQLVANTVILPKLESKGVLTTPVQEILAELFLYRAHPQSFLMNSDTACMPFSDEASHARGAAFHVPLSGASYYFIKNANRFYERRGFDLVLIRLQDIREIELSISEILLYIHVFRVCRFCCTRVWVEKYLDPVSEAVGIRLRNPLYSDLQLPEHMTYMKQAVNNINNLREKCVATCCLYESEIDTTTSGSPHLDLQLSEITNSLLTFETRHKRWLPRVSFLKFCLKL